MMQKPCYELKASKIFEMKNQNVKPSFEWKRHYKRLQ